LQKQLCSGEGLKLGEDSDGAPVRLSPQSRASSPWRVLQGEADRVCSVAQLGPFMADDEQAKVIALPGVAHDYRRAERWIARLQGAFDELSDLSPRPPPAPNELQDLPVVEVQARYAGDAFAVVLSGDGGWAGIDKALAASLAASGVAVIGVDSLRYFWTPRTPEQTAHDVERIIEHT
jgi:type IV secretory pathway VirJ component